MKKILIAAGGTGGHILPALSIATSIKLQAPESEIEFVHGSSALEKNIYSKSSFKKHCFPIGRLRKNVSLKERIKTALTLPFILLKALKLIIKVRPSLVIGTGGAVSGPVLLAAFLLGKRTCIFESNVVPGLTNRWLSYFVKEVIVIFECTKKFFKTKKQIQFPFPVRREIYNIPLKSQVNYPLKVFVLGGSQGSSTINKVVSDFILSEDGAAFSFVHQTGRQDFEELKKKYSPKKNVRVFPFLQDLSEHYAWSDVVVARAGIGTLAELSSAGRAGILIPLASAADSHQLKNAQELAQKSACILIEESQFNSQTFRDLLMDLKQHPHKINQLSSSIYGLKLGTSADSIASYLIGQNF